MNIYENITHYPANHIANPGCYSWCRNMLGKAPRLESRLQLQGLAFRWFPASQRRCRLAAQWVLSQILQPPEGSRVTRAPTFALAKRECALLFSVSSRNNQAHTCTTIGCSILETKEPEEYRTASRMMPVHKYTETLNLHHAVVSRLSTKSLSRLNTSRRCCQKKRTTRATSWPRISHQTVFGRSSIPERTPKRLLETKVTKADALLLKKINKLKYFIQPWTLLEEPAFVYIHTYENT